MLKNILLFSLILLLFSCSNHKNVQVFIATEDLQIGTNRFSVAFADSNGLVNNESLEVSFSGEGGYPKFNKELKFVGFPDYYDVGLNNGLYTEIIDFEKNGEWKISLGDGDANFVVKEISNSLSVGDIAPKSDNLTINETSIENLSTGTPFNNSFYEKKVYKLLEDGELFIVTFMSPAFCIDPTCGPQLDTLNELSNKYVELPIVHIETYLNPVELKNDFDKRKINPIIEDWGVDEGQWLYIVSKSGMIIAKFQGYASLDQIEEYITK